MLGFPLESSPSTLQRGLWEETLDSHAVNGFLRAAQGQGFELQEVDFSITTSGMEMIDLGNRGDSSLCLPHHYKLPVFIWPWTVKLYKGTSRSQRMSELECFQPPEFIDKGMESSRHWERKAWIRGSTAAESYAEENFPSTTHSPPLCTPPQLTKKVA